MADGAGAHGAGLKRHCQNQAGQTIVANRPGRRAQGQDFRMARRIMGGDRLVVSGCEDGAADRIKHHRADGRLALRGRGARLSQGRLHELDVVHACAPRPARY